MNHVKNIFSWFWKKVKHLTYYWDKINILFKHNLDLVFYHEITVLFGNKASSSITKWQLWYYWLSKQAAHFTNKPAINKMNLFTIIWNSTHNDSSVSQQIPLSDLTEFCQLDFSYKIIKEIVTSINSVPHSFTFFFSAFLPELKCVSSLYQ